MFFDKTVCEWSSIFQPATLLAAKKSRLDQISKKKEQKFSPCKLYINMKKLKNFIEKKLQKID